MMASSLGTGLGCRGKRVQIEVWFVLLRWLTFFAPEL